MTTVPLHVYCPLNPAELDALRQWALRVGATRVQIRRERDRRVRHKSGVMWRQAATLAAIRQVHAASLPQAEQPAGQGGQDKQDPPEAPTSKGSTDRTPDQRSHGGRSHQRRA